MRPLHSFLLIGLTTLSSAAQDVSHPTNRAAIASLEREMVEVTCKPAFYKRDNDGFLVPADSISSNESFQVNGIVLSVVEPDRFKGKMIAFHIDFPEQWDHWYKPDRLYRGVIAEEQIGKLSFKCDPGWRTVQTNRVLVAPDPESGANTRVPTVTAIQAGLAITNFAKTNKLKLEKYQPPDPPYLDKKTGCWYINYWNNPPSPGGYLLFKVDPTGKVHHIPGK